MRLFIQPFSLLPYLAIFLFPLSLSGQVAFEVSSDGIPVQFFQDQPANPWAGGINSGQFSNIDLDLDGVQDVLVFDREGDRILPFIQEGSPGFPQLVYHPELREAFPPLKTFVLARDFDQDGKADLFSYQDNGIIVYKNSSTIANGLEFSPYQLTPLMSNVPGNGLQVIEVPSTDIPVLEDLDGDGDLDIVTFNLLGTLLDYHKNLSVETFGNPNSLAFILEEACWGHVMEDDANASLTLGVTCKTGSTTGGDRHAGSSLMSFDVDNDGDHEMVVGDIGSNNLIFLQNGGTPDHADIVSFDANWPASNPVNISIFPAAYFVDIDADENRDLVVAPNDRLFSENRFSAYYYHNTSTDSTPNFTFFQDNLLIEDMLDFGSGAVPILVDYDLDGKTDLLVSNYGNYDVGDFVPQIALFKNNGSTQGAFFDLIDDNLAGLGFQYLSPGIRPTLGDLDNDGDLDMILGQADGSLDFYRNTSVSPTNVLPQFNLETSDFEGIDVGGSASPVLFDVNQDGLLDLVIGERNGNLNYYENTGTSEVAAYSLVSDTFGGVNVSIDGFQPGYSVPTLYQKGANISLLVGSEDGHVYYWKNIAPNLSEAFGQGEPIISPGEEGNRLAPAMADLNGDLFPDLLVGNFGGGIALYEGKEVDSTMVSISASLPNAPSIEVWPNPSFGELNWSIQIQGLFSGQAQLFDLQGRLVQVWSITQARAQQSLSDVSPGVYVLEIQLQGHQPFRQKLMIHSR